MEASDVLPDLQASVLCEDVRQELNGKRLSQNGLLAGN